jgi:hypothetical protein
VVFHGATKRRYAKPCARSSPSSSSDGSTPLPDRDLLVWDTEQTGLGLRISGAPAAAILEAVPLLGPYVFAGLDVAKPLHDLKGVWGRVRARAELAQEIRLYDATRHTFTIWAEELEIPEDRRRLRSRRRRRLHR